MTNWIVTVKYWLGIALVVTLFATGKSTLAFFIILCFIIYHYDSTLKNMSNEIEWMQKAILNKNQRRSLIDETAFYDFLWMCKIEGKIKEGMEITKVKNVLNEQLKKYEKSIYKESQKIEYDLASVGEDKREALKNKSAIESRIDLFFLDLDEQKNEKTIKAWGYGRDYPTPVVIIEFKNKKIVKIERVNFSDG